MSPRQFYRSCYLQARFFGVIAALAVLFFLGFFWPVVYAVAKASLVSFLVIVAGELALLYGPGASLKAEREVPLKFSNGDPNPVTIRLTSRYRFAVHVVVLDEAPPIFQIRDARFGLQLSPGTPRLLRYELTPRRRGTYQFGCVNAFVRTPLRFVARRYRASCDQRVKVYPSFIQMRKYELLALANRLSEVGIKKMRRVGHTMEFDQIRNYVRGDDVRTINWKASARRGDLMVNQYQDERSQQVYCIVDMGRAMKMPFEAMTLLDYAINTSLVLSNIALLKDDKAGLVTFSSQFEAFIPASRRSAQLRRLMDTLYDQATRFLEPDYEGLYFQLRKRVQQRSLLVLFTNFETLNAARRYLPYLRQLAQRHLLVTVLFQNTELNEVLAQPPADQPGIYRKAIAEQFALEKQQIAQELRAYGIITLLTPPAQLTVNTLNKYLQLKAQGQI